jgi:trk system potassium uptake protein TrkH
VVILTGAVVLTFPFVSAGKPIRFIDALFTATSAVCVTGLSVFDIGTQLSFAGQCVVLLLVQVGGVGTVVFSTMIILMAGKTPDIISHLILKDSFTGSNEKSPAEILRDVIRITLSIEIIGAVFLFLRFFQDFEPKRAVFLAIFHSVCAFCNAGFSLFYDNLLLYRDDVFLNITICALIICGGLGYLVIAELMTVKPFNNKRWRKLSLHSKLVLTSTFYLLCFSTLVIACMEWNNILRDLSLSNRFLTSFFQAVTARTAGFNTLHIGQLTDETLFFIIILMLIGAGPGSCAGGVKITTFSTMVVAGISKLLGRNQPFVFRRSLSQLSIDKAVTVFFISILIVHFGTMLLAISEIGGAAHPKSGGKFLELLFETTSALGTVGLSTGITPSLSDFGKMIITLTMLIGRVGTLTIVAAVSHSLIKSYHYPKEDVMIG